jgi:sugar/nucleoside kinase (ribokinase family)
MVTVLGATGTLSLDDFDISIIQSTRHLHVGSFYMNTGIRKDLKNIFIKAKEWGISTSLDTGWDVNETWEDDILPVLEYTDVFIPNETEAMHIVKAATLEEAATELEKICTKTVAIKCGKKGGLLLAGGKRYAIDAMDDVKVVDTTGAGDSFNAGFLYGYLKGLPLPTCLEYGNACGNISVGTVGGTGADLDEEKIIAMIESHDRCREL